MPFCPECGVEIVHEVAHCPGCRAELSGLRFPATSGERRSTLVEPAPRGLALAGGQMRRETLAEGGSLPKSRHGVSQAVPFRPLYRQPIAVLCALDDGDQKTGENWRVRTARYVIGRVAGDVVIPNDPDLSGEHAAILCKQEHEAFRWYLKDLGSTNGTFLRVSRSILRDGKELLVGRRRYAFRAPTAAAMQSTPEENQSEPMPTRKFQALDARLVPPALPALVELTPAGDGRELRLTTTDCLMGADGAQCPIRVEDDPFVDPVHARVYLDSKGRWTIDDRESLNGLWIRISEAPLDSTAEFQLGEQRFRIRFP